MQNIQNLFIDRHADNLPAKNSWTIFRKKFIWKKGSSTELFFSADPTARIELNNAVILDRTMRCVYPQIAVEKIDLQPWLIEGENQISVLHHYWGVSTFQRSAGGSSGIACSSPFLVTDETWEWSDASEFLAHPHQTLGHNTPRIRFPVIIDLRNDARRTWLPACRKYAAAWSKPLLKETPRLTRTVVHAGKTVACGSVTSPSADQAPTPAAPVSWLVKNSSYETDLSRVDAATLSPGKEGYWTLDFGKPIHGSLVLEIESAAAGTILDFTYGELKENLHSSKPSLHPNGYFDPEEVIGTPFGDRITLKTGKQTAEIPEERTWRWLMITWRGATQPVKISKIMGIVSETQVDEWGTFEGGPEAVTPLIRLSLDHAKVCMSDVYVDTPGREDGQWIEDIQFRARLSAQWFNEIHLRQVTLRHTVEQQAADGLFRVFPPDDYGTQGVKTIDWGLVWIGILTDDYQWTGSTVRLKLYLPAMERFLSEVKSYTNTHGLLAQNVRSFENGGSTFNDIRVALRAKAESDEVESTPNAWLYGFLKEASAIAELLKRHDLAAEWNQWADLIKRSFRCFITTLPEGSPTISEVYSPQEGGKGFGQAAVINAIDYGLIAPDESRPYLIAAFNNEDGSPPPMMSRWNNPTYIYRALTILSQAGLGKCAARHLIERYAPYLPDGPLPEYFIRGSGQPADPTGSHGWAAVPLVWLHDTLLGVQIQQPGGLTLRWKPIDVGWGKVTGKTMTPLGLVEITVDWPEKSFSWNASFPVNVETHIPLSLSLEKPSFPGDWKKQGDCWVAMLELQTTTLRLI